MKTNKVKNIDYNPRLKSAEAENKRNAKSSAAKGYELNIRNPKAKNAARVYTESVVGRKLKLQLKPKFRLLNVSDEDGSKWVEQFEDLFDGWANSVNYDCDASRTQNLTSILATLANIDFIAGESFLALEWSLGHAGYKTCLNIIDPARICNPNNKPNNETLENGIEINKFGAPIAYWIRSGHPSDFNQYSKATWTRVPKYTKFGRPLILHSFKKERAGQRRGISRFSSTANELNNLASYNAAELERAMVQSMFGAYIKSTLDVKDAMEVVGADYLGESAEGNEGTKLEKINAAAIKATAAYYSEMPKINGAHMLHLLPNEEMGLIQPEQAVDAFETFNMIANREISAGFGVDVHNMSKNYKDVSYSAARAAQEDAFRSYLTERQRLQEDYAMPIVSCFMEEVIQSGKLQLPLGVDSFYKNKNALCVGSLMGQGKPNIDPVKTAKANETELRLGLKSRSEICADRGADFRDVVDEIAKDLAYMKSKNVNPEDLDPDLIFNRNSVDASNANKENEDSEDDK